MIGQPVVAARPPARNGKPARLFQASASALDCIQGWNESQRLASWSSSNLGVGFGQKRNRETRLFLEKSSNVIDDTRQVGKRSPFAQNAEGFFRVNRELFVLQQKVRSDRGQNQSSFVVFTVDQPKFRSVAEQKQLPRRFDPTFRLQAPKTLLELFPFMDEIGPLSNEFFVGAHVQVAQSR